MKILHINSYQEGGAAWCAIRISKALSQEGEDCRMLFAEGDAMPDGVDGAIALHDNSVWRSNPVLRRIHNLLLRMPWYVHYIKMNKEMWAINEHLSPSLFLHQPLSDYKNIAHHPLVEWADVIHLHWVSGFVDYPSFFRKVNKPIVWTLHDKHPAVGVQHYCSPHSPVPDLLKPFEAKCRRIKRKGVLEAKHLHLVAISEEMKQLCKESEVLAGIPVSLIHNGVDIDLFRYHGNSAFDMSREDEGLDSSVNWETATLFMFAAYGIWDSNKGLQRVIDALERVDNCNKVLLVVGNNFENNVPQASFPIVCIGLVTDQTRMARLYSIADFFIQASYEESFGQTCLEAMSCGTPVVSTPVGISPDLIKPFNGVVCSGFDSESLKCGIEKALLTKYDTQEIRQYVVDNYSYDKIAKQYIELYKKVLCVD